MRTPLARWRRLLLSSTHLHPIDVDWIAPAEIVEQLGLSAADVERSLFELAARGLIEGAGGLTRLTPKAMSDAGVVP